MINSLKECRPCEVCGKMPDLHKDNKNHLYHKCVQTTVRVEMNSLQESIMIWNKVYAV